MMIELKRLSQDEENQFRYEMRQKAILDEQSRLSSAKKQGLAEGKAEGILENQSEMARMMLSDGLDENIAAKYTKLSIEEIHKIMLQQ